MGEVTKTDTGIQQATRVRLSEIRKNIIDSGLLEMYIQMGLTGREYFVNPETHEVKISQQEDSYISQPERMKIMSTLINKVLPVLKDVEEEQKQQSILEDIAKRLNDNEKSG